MIRHETENVKTIASSRLISIDYSGISAGFIRAILGHPFDTIKVKMQTHPELYKSSLDSLIKTVSNDGFLSLYRGITFPLFGNAVIVGIHFSTWNHLKNNYNSFIAGGLAGALSSIISSPLEFVRIKMQLANTLDNKKIFLNELSCIHEIVKDNPLRIYKGLHVTLLRDFIGYGAFFTTYKYTPKFTGNKLVDDILKGILCGFALWSSMYPIDVIKSRIQGELLNTKQPLTAIQYVKLVYINFGWKGFFKGFDSTMVRAVPVNIGIVLSIEASKSISFKV